MYSNNTNLNRSNTRGSNRTNNSPPSPTLSRSSTAVGSVGQAKRRHVFHCIPARVGLGMFIPLLFFFAIFMIVAGGLIAGRLLHQAHKLSRLAIIFQLTNYSIVVVIAALGMHAIIRHSLRASQFFTCLLMGQLPFGIVAGAISMRVIFRAASNTTQNAASQLPDVASAAASSNVTSSTEVVAARAVEAATGSWEETCSAALHGLTFICERWHRVQPLIVVAYLLFWFLEMIVIYTSIVYIRQLSSKAEVKILDNDDDA